MKSNDVYNLLSRYLILIILGVFISFIYLLFSYLTIYPVYWLLHLVDGGTRLFAGSTIFFKGFYADIVSACVAGAAYYLLLILNLATPMGLKTRIRSVGFMLGSFLVLNIIRIFVFALLLVYGQQYFDSLHIATWYFGSTILVVGVWFLTAFLFKIKEIPIYTDLTNLVSEIRRGK